MRHEPITYCKGCCEPFDVYRAPGDQICDGCLDMRIGRSIPMAISIPGVCKMPLCSGHKKGDCLTCPETANT